MGISKNVFVALLVFAVSACVVETETVYSNDSGLDTSSRNPCYRFQVLEDRGQSETLPYIGAGSADFLIYVDSPNFVPTRGAAYPQDDGTTQVWHVYEFHYEDGGVDIGALGHVEGDTDGWCTWLTASRTEDI